MELTGRDILLVGPFEGFEVGELRRRLEAAGAHVTEELTGATFAVFAGTGASADTYGEAYALGVPQHDEAALAALLDGLEAKRTGAVGPGGFAEPAMLAAAGPEKLAELLRGARVRAFTPARDLPPLRRRLAELEAEHGVTEAHRLATRLVCGSKATLSAPYRHRSEITSVALSPSGAHVATAEWGEGDSGVALIWEVSTGKCVNALEGISGGIGWWGRSDCVQWSADGTRLGMAFDTNAVGVWDPFGEGEPLAEARVTEGHSRPPGWALSPDGLSAMVAVGNSGLSDRVTGCVVPLERGVLSWSADAVEGTHPYLLSDGNPVVREGAMARWDELDTDGTLSWSVDGRRLYAAARSEAFVVDVAGGRPLWGTRVDRVAAWSPDGRLLAHLGGGRLHIRDGATGDPVVEPVPHAGSRFDTSLRWGARGATARLAVVCDGESRRPGVEIHDDGRSVHRLETTPARTHDVGDFANWAWAPSGDRAAVLTAAGEIEVWALDDGTPRRLHALAAPAGTRGVLWGAEETVVAVGPETLRFLRAGDGAVLGDFAYMLEAGGEPPVPREFLWDERLEGRLFALDEHTWCLPVGPHGAIAPPERRADVETRLAWIAAGRFAWPLRWGDFALWPDAETAMSRTRVWTDELAALRDGLREAGG